MLSPVDPAVFEAMRAVDVEALAAYSECQLRPVLPCLVRMSLIAPLDQSVECADKRKTILCLLSGYEVVNSLVALLSVDFSQLETELARDLQASAKNAALSSAGGGRIPDSAGLESAVSEFERSEPLQKLRVVLAPLVTALTLSRRDPSMPNNCGDSGAGGLVSCELLDNAVHLEELADVLCVALAELPHLLTPVDVCGALIHLRHGAALTCRVVANMPDCVESVCHALVVSSPASADEDSASVTTRACALRRLCVMYPPMTAVVRDQCVRQCRLASLMMALSLSPVADADSEEDTQESDDELVAFLSGLLLGDSQQVRLWLQGFVRVAQKRKSLQAAAALQDLRTRLLALVQRVLLAIGNEAIKRKRRYILRAAALVRLYCALRGIAGLKFSEDELPLLLQLLTSRLDACSAGVQLITVSLCALVGCPSLLALPEHERLAAQWLQWLAREERFFESTSRQSMGSAGGSQFGQMLLLLASHFHANNVSAAMDVVNATLGMRLNTRHASIARVRHIFTQDVFTEQTVVVHAVRVRVTPKLSALVPGTLPVHCVEQLLKSRAFNKHRTPVGEWILAQLCESCAPIHAALPSLIDNFVKSLVDASQHRVRPADDGVVRLDEAKISALFQLPVDADSTKLQDAEGASVPEPLTAQLLLLYYMLLYEDRRIAAATSSSSSGQRSILPPYRERLTDSLPTDLLLRRAQSSQHLYAGLYAPLISLVCQHHPHLCVIGQWMSDDIAEASAAADDDDFTADDVDASIRRTSICRTATSGEDEAAFVERVERSMLALPASAVGCCRLIGQLNVWSTDTTGELLWRCAGPAIRHAACLLRAGVPRHLQQQFARLWSRLSDVHAERLFVATANALCRPGAPPLTSAQLGHDPLAVLRCDQRVFRCPPLLALVLRVLAAQLALSRAQLQRHVAHMPSSASVAAAVNAGGDTVASGATGVSDSEVEELRGALVLTQESAVVQILIEACLETREDRSAVGGAELLQEVRALVCSHLHQTFIESPTLAKLVHFQGYPVDALPVLVAGVPSMHICLDFVAELLSQPDLDKQAFAVQLVAYLTRQFPIARCVANARLAVSTLSSLLATASTDETARLFISTLPALRLLVEAHRPLAEDVAPLLLQLAAVSSCQRHLEETVGGDNGSHMLLAQVRSTFVQVCRAVIGYGDIY